MLRYHTWTDRCNYIKWIENIIVRGFQTSTVNENEIFESIRIMPHITYQIAGAAGGLKSTLNDLMKYINENISEKDIAMKLTHKKSIEINGKSIGLGWQIKQIAGETDAFWHNGGEPGFSSFCMVIPEEQLGIVCLSNTGGLQDELSQLSFRIIENLHR